MANRLPIIAVIAAVLLFLLYSSVFVVKEAQGEAQRFISVYDAYAKAPDVTRKRLYLETMQNVLGKSRKVILDEKNGQGVLPYLPLNEIGKPAQSGGAQ